MSPELSLLLDDIKTCCAKVVRYTTGMSADQFIADDRTYDAVLWNLAVVGEAVKALSPALRNRHPEVDWRRIAGLRDILIHEYFGIDNVILWDIVQNKVPALLAQVERLIREESS